MFSRSRPPYFILKIGLGLVVLGQAPIIGAETLSGTLAADAGAIKVHPVDCPGGTYLLASQILNGTESAPSLSTQSVKGKKATNSTDPTAGDGNYSPLAFNVGGSGRYYLTVTKWGNGSADYTVQYYCRTLSEVLQAGLLSVVPPQVANEAREGATTYHTLDIGQGCQTTAVDANGVFKVNPVIAESVLFPSAVESGERSDTGEQVALQDVISNADGSIGTVSPIQNKSIFKSQDRKLDAGGNVIGFHGVRGNLKTNLVGRVPFAFTAPTFNAASCAKRLLVKIAVADICKTGNKLDIGKVNLWIPDTTSKFSDSTLIPGSDGTVHSGFPATLVINRATALDAGCGAGYDVTVWPGDDLIDAYLPIRKYWQP